MDENADLNLHPKQEPGWERDFVSVVHPAESAVTWKEIVASFMLVVLSDLTLYRNEGYAGLVPFFLLAPLLVLFGHCRAKIRSGSFLIYVALAILTLKLIWLGGVLQVFCLILLLMLLIYSFSETMLLFSGVLFSIPSLLISGLMRSTVCALELKRFKMPTAWIAIMNYGLPLFVTGIFGLIFILANPDLLRNVSSYAADFLEQVGQWLQTFQIHELFFWGLMACLALGAMNPFPTIWKNVEHPSQDTALAAGNFQLFPAYRNTLVMLNILFVIYLGFEFMSLWKRDFPAGFYYAGYAHQGAGWLTLALAFSTLILSIIFRRESLRDPRISVLRWLAWGWSALNMLLAVAVYNRLLIYIDFNGLTRMRIVGILGTTAVLLGFLLVVYKICYEKKFSWLVQRQMWVPFAMAYIYALLPVDWIVFEFNARKVMGGNLPPAVQMSVQPLDADGLVPLIPLMKHSNAEISTGIESLLRTHYFQLKHETEKGKFWQRYQGSRNCAIAKIEQAFQAQQKVLDDSTSQKEADENQLRKFHEYVYQWY